MPNAFYCSAYLVDDAQSAEKNVEKNENGGATDRGYEPTCCRKAREKGVDAGAGLGKKACENGDLREKGEQGDEQNEQRIDGSFGHNGAYGLGE